MDIHLFQNLDFLGLSPQAWMDCIGINLHQECTRPEPQGALPTLFGYRPAEAPWGVFRPSSGIPVISATCSGGSLSSHPVISATCSPLHAGPVQSGPVVLLSPLHSGPVRSSPVHSPPGRSGGDNSQLRAHSRELSLMWVGSPTWEGKTCKASERPWRRGPAKLRSFQSGYPNRPGWITWASSCIIIWTYSDYPHRPG